MALTPKLAGRKKRRMVLRYDRELRGRLLETRVDLTLESNGGEVVATPITPLYELRLIPFFNVPKRGAGLELRKLTVCIANGGERTVYLPYLPIDPNHNAMIQEYLDLLLGDTFDGLQYRGEDFTL